MHKETIKIRLAKPNDAKSILEVHYDAVHKIASKDYDKKILNDWSPPVTAKRVKDYKKKSRIKIIRLVANINGKIVGFGTLTPKDCRIGAVYVSPKAKRRGVGALLLRELENIARKLHIKKLKLESSITAEKFYNKNGYKSLKNSYFALRTGRKMKCIKMAKKL